VKCPGHTNFPFRVCSQSAGYCSDVFIRSAETKSRAGKALIEWTRSQPEWRGKDSGRRNTNDRKHRKGKPSAGVVGRDGCFRFRRATVRLAKSVNIEEESGNMHSIWRRCKRRRHELKVTDSNWGDPASFQSTNRLITIDGLSRLINLAKIDSYPLDFAEISGCVRISSDIRRKAESLNDVIQEVGDGHSSDDGEDNITSLEQRAISLTMSCAETRRLW